MKQVSAQDVATFFKTTSRAASILCIRWVEDGFLVVTDASKKHRRYSLAEQYESLVAEQSAVEPTEFTTVPQPRNSPKPKINEAAKPIARKLSNKKRKK